MSRVSGLYSALSTLALLPLSIHLAAAPLPTPAEAKPVPATCMNFKEEGWSFHRNSKAKGWPRVSRGVLKLLPDNRYGAGVAAVLKSQMQPPYEVTFEFRTYDDDGGPGLIWNSADGVSFFFLKDGDAYRTPPPGGDLGFAREGGGYAVMLSTHGQRQARLRSADGITFASMPFRSAYTHGKWVPVRIQVGDERVEAWSGQRRLLSVSLNYDTQYSDIGFSAGTGAADSEHQVRNFCIRSLGEPVVQEPVVEPPVIEPPVIEQPPEFSTQVETQLPAPQEQSLPQPLEQVPLPTPSASLPDTTTQVEPQPSAPATIPEEQTIPQPVEQVPVQTPPASLPDITTQVEPQPPAPATVPEEQTIPQPVEQVPVQTLPASLPDITTQVEPQPPAPATVPEEQTIPQPVEQVPVTTGTGIIDEQPEPEVLSSDIQATEPDAVEENAETQTPEVNTQPLETGNDATPVASDDVENNTVDDVGDTPVQDFGNEVTDDAQ